MFAPIPREWINLVQSKILLILVTLLYDPCCEVC